MAGIQHCSIKKMFREETVTVLADSDRDSQDVEIKFTKEIIVPEPSEKIHLELSIKPGAVKKRTYCCHYGTQRFQAAPPKGLFNLRCYYCGVNIENFLYTLTLQFKNNIHETHVDYYYKVSVNVQIPKNDEYDHLELFSNICKRSSSQISLTNSFYFQNDSLEGIKHFCVAIARSNPEDYKSFENLEPVQLDRQLFSDISILVDDKTFYAHKYILASKSDVFKAMLSHDMLENKNGSIKIDDSTCEAVAEFLDYIYTNKIKNTSNTLSFDLYKLADKYAVDGLKKKCLEQIIFSLNCENAVEIFKFASLYEETKLQEKLLSFMNKYEEKVVKSTKYRQFLCENLTVETLIDSFKLS